MEKVSAHCLAFLCSHGAPYAIASAAYTVYLCKQEPKYFPQALLKERDILKNGMQLFLFALPKMKGNVTSACQRFVGSRAAACVWP